MLHFFRPRGDNIPPSWSSTDVVRVSKPKPKAEKAGKRTAVEQKASKVRQAQADPYDAYEPRTAVSGNGSRVEERQQDHTYPNVGGLPQLAASNQLANTAHVGSEPMAMQRSTCASSAPFAKVIRPLFETHSRYETPSKRPACRAHDNIREEIDAIIREVDLEDLPDASPAQQRSSPTQPRARPRLKSPPSSKQTSPAVVSSPQSLKKRLASSPQSGSMSVGAACAQATSACSSPSSRSQLTLPVDQPMVNQISMLPASARDGSSCASPTHSCGNDSRDVGQADCESSETTSPQPLAPLDDPSAPAQEEPRLGLACAHDSAALLRQPGESGGAKDVDTGALGSGASTDAADVDEQATGSNAAPDVSRACTASVASVSAPAPSATGLSAASLVPVPTTEVSQQPFPTAALQSAAATLPTEVVAPPEQPASVQQLASVSVQLGAVAPTSLPAPTAATAAIAATEKEEYTVPNTMMPLPPPGSPQPRQSQVSSSSSRTGEEPSSPGLLEDKPSARAMAAIDLMAAFVVASEQATDIQRIRAAMVELVSICKKQRRAERGSSSFAQAVIHGDGIVGLVRALKAHPELESIQVMACFLFCRMSESESHMQLMARAGALEIVAAAFQNHPTSSRLAQWGAAAALKLTHNSVVRAQLAIEAGLQRALEDFIAASSQDSSTDLTRVRLLLRWLSWHADLVKQAREHEPAPVPAPFWPSAPQHRHEVSTARIAASNTPSARPFADASNSHNPSSASIRTGASAARRATDPVPPPRIPYHLPWWLRCFGVQLPHESTSVPWSPYQRNVGDT